jgi:hypothetical protein
LGYNFQPDGNTVQENGERREEEAKDQSRRGVIRVSCYLGNPFHTGGSIPIFWGEGERSLFSPRKRFLTHILKILKELT